MILIVLVLLLLLVLHFRSDGDPLKERTSRSKRTRTIGRMMRRAGVGLACAGSVSLGKNDLAMELPSQIQDKLDALGVLAADIEERFVRGSGPGGQKINKTSSTVHLRHGPTGVEVRVQRERSQAANRELAWTELCAKLGERMRAQQAARKAEVEKTRRRKRQKSRGQKARMVADKRHHSSAKARRGKVKSEE